ncbi:MAG: response regulator [Anaerolineae bacterium]|nr:response regulator [Anaerolineae bacterium]
MPREDIVVADDDPVALRLLARIIEMTGYKATTARNGQEAVEKIRELQPALVVIDIMMPRFDGFEVCQQIRNDPTLTHQPYIIMLTARDQAADYRRADEIGVNEFINKPFSPAKVTARVQAILGQKQ